MKPYILEQAYTKELDNLIETNKVKPLIEEMYYQYGLKVVDSVNLIPTRYGKDVIHVKTYGEIYHIGVTDKVTGFILSLDGLPYACVYTAEINNQLTYFFYAKYHAKAKARFGNVDRHTTQSIHIESLMKTIEKNNAIPTDDFIISDALRTFSQQQELLYPHEGGKEYYVLGRSIKSHEPYEEMTGFTIGKIMFSVDGLNYIREITDLFQYVNHVDNYEHKTDLIPKMTMIKVWLDNQKHLRNNIFFVRKERSIRIDDSLIVGICENASPLSYAWTFIPTQQS
mgnify:CR=1 FL=1